MHVFVSASAVSFSLEWGNSEERVRIYVSKRPIRFMFMSRLQPSSNALMRQMIKFSFKC